MLEALAEVLVTALADSSVEASTAGRVEIGSGEAVVQGSLQDFQADLVAALQQVVLAAAAATSAWAALDQAQVQD